MRGAGGEGCSLAAWFEKRTEPNGTARRPPFDLADRDVEHVDSRGGTALASELVHAGDAALQASDERAKQREVAERNENIIAIANPNPDAM